MMPINPKSAGGLRFRVCPDCGEMHDKYAWPDNHRRPEEVVCAPNFVSDIMDPVQSMGNGLMYDSKSEIRKHYKRDGITEVGNDPARMRPKRKEKIDPQKQVDAIDKAMARFNRGERIKGSRRPNDAAYTPPI